MSEWISVKDSLPNTNERYLVITEDGRYFDAFYECYFIGLRKFEIWRDYQDCSNLEDITHWMPLPEPPKEDK